MVNCWHGQVLLKVFLKIEWHHDSIVTLYLKALEYEIKIDYFTSILERNYLLDIPNPEQWEWPLKIYVMGGFNVYLNGKRLIFRKNNSIRQDLLIQLIIQKDNRIDRNKLVNKIWSGRVAQKSLAVDIHRLKNVLGEHIFKSSENQVALNHRICWVDVWNIELIIKNITILLEKKSDKKQLENLSSELFRLYKGSMLKSNNDNDDVESFDLCIQNSCVDVIEKLGNYWTEIREWKPLVLCALKGLEINQYNESFFYMLINCYKEQGNIKKAKEIYNNCRRILKKELNSVPSSKIQKLFMDLV